jgi:hypothetical protein
MSNTPETDFVRKSNDCDAAGFGNMMLHARKLERERDEAREKATAAWTENLRLDAKNRRMERERNEDRDCGQEGVCANPPGCQRHWLERNRELIQERDEARELAEQMSESNQVLLADVRFYRQAWEQLKEAAK